jgi:hypothetical protein
LSGTSEATSAGSADAVLETYLARLIAWLESNGWSGWDPYDLWDNPIGLWAMAGESLAQRIANGVLSRLEELFPMAVRHVLGAQRQINAKGMGLFAAAFLDLEQVAGAPVQVRGTPAMDQCFGWLEENRVRLGDATGWGYPFDWRTRVLIPRNTPTAVTTSIIGDAYWVRYARRGHAASLQRCEEICRFFLERLNRSPRASDRSFCFSYTPVDHFQVHNANLMVAEFLIRVGRETGRDEWAETGLDAARFALRETREDGSLPYWSNEQSKELQQDLFHSGFEIRSLDAIARLTGRAEFRAAADRYFQTWLADYFAPDGTPGFSGERPGAVEVHSCAEALLCASQLAGRPGLPVEALPAHVARSLAAAVRHLWVPTGKQAGYFGWISQPRYGVRIRTRIPLIRMGQAWMLRAMSLARVALRSGGSLVAARRTAETTPSR